MFDYSSFMPHGHCYLWRPEILWLNVISDGFIALAYFSIPIALIYFVNKRQDLAFRWMFVAFGLFITFCGLSHLVSIYTTWTPNYGLQGMVKATTAVISVITAGFLWPLLPLALKLPSPKQLEDKNKELMDLNENLEKKVTEKVKDSLLLAEIVNHSQDAIISKDINNRVLSWNKAAEKIYQYTAQEIIGQSVMKLVPSRKYLELENVHQKIYKGESIEPFETVRIRKDGLEVAVFVTISPIRNSKGDVVGASTISRDITTMKQLTEKLSRYTEEIQNKNEQLLRTNRAKDEFIANLSHELRNPINIIVGYSDLLENLSPTSKEYQTAVAAIRKSAHTQLHLIEDLLDMSRIVSGKFSLNIGSHDVRDIVESALAAVRHAADSKSIAISTNVEKESPLLICDADRMKQVLWNLLTNAVKFTHPGGKITLKATRENGDFVFDIKDDGEGISRTDLPHLFDRLWQSESTTRRDRGGLGLGLNITKDLVEAHGGSIKASSEGLGKGSRFTVQIPVKALGTSPMDEKLRVAGKSLDGITILIVDDQPEALELMEIALVNEGAKIVKAAHGAEALGYIKSNNIDFIISDINMPVMDGHTFIEEARDFESKTGHPHRPAIALTARTGTSEANKSLSSGYNLHLVKPVKSFELVGKVAQLMRPNLN